MCVDSAIETKLHSFSDFRPFTDPGKTGLLMMVIQEFLLWDLRRNKFPSFLHIKKAILCVYILLKKHTIEKSVP